jgi:D-arabinose 1-dehydrogenase-like Zn-dependent alcohol dehydrogenase
MVVNERYAICIPKNAPLAAAAPLLCAGATMYDPLVRNGWGLMDSARHVRGFHPIQTTKV